MTSGELFAALGKAVLQNKAIPIHFKCYKHRRAKSWICSSYTQSKETILQDIYLSACALTVCELTSNICCYIEDESSYQQDRERKLHSVFIWYGSAASPLSSGCQEGGFMVDLSERFWSQAFSCQV